MRADQSLLERARRRLRGIGRRSSEHRARVLAALTQAARPLSHHELAERLAPIDKVTLYRVLDWMVAQGIAHRLAGSDRVWRFAVAGPAHAGHAHFECSRCCEVMCLGAIPAQALALGVPRGCRLEGVELTAKGLCARCA
jgi:Fur family transcriptional regulator, ferric uptake regulator